LDRSKILNIRFTFQAKAMLALVRSSGLPIWWTKRPQTVAWVVVEKAGKRSIVGAGDNSSLSNEIFVQADLRGLPIGLPLMDLDDSILVSVSDIWGKFTQVLTSASLRYEAAQYLIGRFSVQEILGERLYSGEWQLMKVENKSEESIVQAGLFNEAKIVSTRSLQAQNIQEVALRGVDIATTSLAEEFAIFGGDPKYHQIRVSGLDSLKGYSNLVSYLSGFEFIQKVNILALQDDVISLQIISPASIERLVSLLALEGRLVDTTLVDSPPQMGWRG
jgi:hypothetical protein